MDTIVFPITPLINEFSASTVGADLEYIEIVFEPNTAISGYHVLQIEGDAGAAAGTIDSATAVAGTTDANGLLLLSLPANTLENGTLTLVLVQGFTGSVGQDLDTDNDGRFNLTPWSTILDSVAVNDGGAGDLTYSDVVLGPNYDGLSGFAPGGASRIPDGRNTRSPSDWARNDFDLAGIPGFTGTPELGEAINTPGAQNRLVTLGDDGGGDDDLVTIMQIQGSGHVSPLLGQRVKTGGVVTVVSNNGFYLQDPMGDGTLATSDGIFVFTGARPTVSLGDSVVVTATVLEFARNASPGHLTLTQLGNTPLVEVRSSGNPLPAPVVVGEGGRLPPTEVIHGDGFATYDPVLNGVDFYESLEGMLVEVRDAVAVAPSFNSASNRGETWVVGDNGAFATNLNSRGGLTLSETDGNPERIQVQANANILPGFGFSTNVGDRLGTITGVMDYDNRGNYEILVTAPFTVTAGGIEREATFLAGSERGLLVGTFNVENLSPLSGAEKYALLGQQIARNLNAPDIIALQEIQDNSGPADDGVTDAAMTYAMLIEAILAAGGPEYAFFDIAPANNTSGGQPGGNIRVGYLYNPLRVDLIEESVAQVLDTDLGDGDAWASSRIPLRGDFVFAGETVTLINNHWSSKGGSSPQFGSIQPLINGALDSRIAQATVVYEYVAALLGENPAAAVMVMGDLNEFLWEAPLEIVTGRAAGAQILFSLFEEQFPQAEHFEYVFDGNHQVLDHVLVSAALRPLAAFDPVHVNSQWSVLDPGRSSDHDPAVVLIGFPLPSREASLTFDLWRDARFDGTPATWQGRLAEIGFAQAAAPSALQRDGRDPDGPLDAAGITVAEAMGDMVLLDARFSDGVAIDPAGPAPLVSLAWAGGGATLTHAAPWNTVKVLTVTAFTGSALTVEGWVDVAVDLSGRTEALALTVDGVKRGSVRTGDGDDVIVIGADSNEARWSNLFQLDTGAGDDVVTIGAASRAYAAESFARSFLDAFARAEVRLGEGDDRFDGTGRDTALYDGPIGGYLLTALEGGGVRVEDIDPANGDEGTDTLFGVAFLRFGGTRVAVDDLFG